VQKEVYSFSFLVFR